MARALDRFWTAGYAATSLDDLAAATGMNRPSLYGAFGDKRAMFLKAMDRYRSRGGQILPELVAAGRPVRDTLEQAYRAALDIYFSGTDGARGCFLTGAALSTAVADEAVRTSLHDGLAEIDQGFAALFLRARETGEIAPDADPDALAFLASALLHSLSVRARSGTPRAQLERSLQAGLDALLGRGPEVAG